MEKIISPEERIRRAEEIYYRRKINNNNVRMPSSHVTENRGNRQFSLYKKMVLQILICILIYLIFSLIKDANYLFSESVINKAKEVLSMDINFSNICRQVENFYNNNKDKFGIFNSGGNEEGISNENSQENQNIENLQDNQNTENIINKETNNVNQESEVNEENNNQGNAVSQENTNNQQSGDSKSNEDEENKENQSNETNQEAKAVGIGGASNAEITNEESVEVSSEGSSKKTQMEIDAEYIKKNFSMVLPAKEEITSHYGKRTPTKIISENHQGIDIGVAEGTEIVSAMDGTVSVVSNEGDYGTHVKIVNKDVTTIYAHCSKILVKEGKKVKKGEKIALSGNTGNTTGPHLHFEIRRDDRTVDPELILSWN